MEVDLTQPLEGELFLNGERIRLESEGLYTIAENTDMMGIDVRCSQSQRNLYVEPANHVTGEEATEAGQATPEATSQEGRYGSWMAVALNEEAGMEANHKIINKGKFKIADVRSNKAGKGFLRPNEGEKKTADKQAQSGSVEVSNGTVGKPKGSQLVSKTKPVLLTGLVTLDPNTASTSALTTETGTRIAPGHMVFMSMLVGKESTKVADGDREIEPIVVGDEDMVEGSQGNGVPETQEA